MTYNFLWIRTRLPHIWNGGLLFFLVPSVLFCFWVFILGASATSSQSLITTALVKLHISSLYEDAISYFFLLTQVGSESCFFLSRAKAQLGGLSGHSRGVSTNEQQLEVGLFSAASTIVLFFFLYIKHCGALEDVDTSLFHLKPFKKCRLPCVNTQLSVLLPFWLRFGSRTFEVWWWRMWHLCVSSGWIQVGSILSKAGSDSSLSGELVSLQGRIFSLDELTWQG